MVCPHVGSAALKGLRNYTPYLVHGTGVIFGGLFLQRNSFLGATRASDFPAVLCGVLIFRAVLKATALYESAMAMVSYAAAATKTPQIYCLLFPLGKKSLVRVAQNRM